jgi:hypothetical protein
MLNHLHLESFRAFGAPTTIPLAPITLLFGENSSGKSSILHALTLLKQTQEAENKEAALVSRGLVDLGSFEEFVFDHDTDRHMTIGFAHRVIGPTRGMRRQPLWTRRFLGKSGETGFSWSFKRDQGTGTVKLSRIALRRPDSMAEYARYEHAADRQPQDPSTLGQVAWPAKLAHLERDEEGRASILKVLTEAWPALTEQLEGQSNEMTDAQGSLSEPPGWLRNRRRDGLDKENPDLQALVQILRTGPTQETVDAIIKFRWDDIEWFRHALQVEARPRQLPVFGLGATAEILRRVFFEHQCAHGAEAVSVASHLALAELDRLVPIGPFRQPAARVYSFLGSAPGTVGRGGELVPELLHQSDDALDRVNDWFKRFEIRYQLRLKKLGGKTRSDIFELRLRDRARPGGVEVAFNDVGFGISQMLPIIVQAVASERRIITIEQPEVHIHPRLQAEIGDLLVETMHENRHQFLVETHSEHLILRLRRLVRDRILKPSDLCVLHVARGCHGAEVKRIHVGEDGTFLDEWPGGFFPERLRELI